MYEEPWDIVKDVKEGAPGGVEIAEVLGLRV